MSEIQRVLVTGPTGKVGRTFLPLENLSKARKSCSMSSNPVASIQFCVC
jgi:hypothetical protein